MYQWRTVCESSVWPDRQRGLAEGERIVSPQLYVRHPDAGKRHLGGLFVFLLMFLSVILKCVWLCVCVCLYMLIVNVFSTGMCGVKEENQILEHPLIG